MTYPSTGSEAGDETPATQPAGDIAPPARRPPTAVGADSAAEPPPPPRSPQPPASRLRTVEWSWGGAPRRPVALPPFMRDVIAAIDQALEELDPIADRIAAALGIRPRIEPPKFQQPPE